MRGCAVPRLAAPVGRPASPSVGKGPRQSEVRTVDGSDGRRGRGGPEIESRGELFPGGGLPDVSQRERPHPNKRLKLSAPRAPAGGATQATAACDKEAVDLYPLRRFAPQLKRRTLASLIRQSFCRGFFLPGSVPRGSPSGRRPARGGVRAGDSASPGAWGALGAEDSLPEAGSASAPARASHYGRAKPRTRSRAPNRVSQGSLADLGAGRQAV